MEKISKKGLSNGEPLELIKLSYILSPTKFQDKFNSVIKGVSEKDLQTLASFKQQGLDKNGFNGQMQPFDIIEMVKMNWTQEEKSKVVNNKDLFVD